MAEDAPSAQTSLFDQEADAETSPDDHADPSGPVPAVRDDGGGSPSPDEAAAVVPSEAPAAREAEGADVQGARRPGGRSTFALGRTDRRTTELRVLEDADSPISGPFRVKAIVSDSARRAPPAPPDA